MSQGRITAVEFNLEILEEVAKALGHEVRKNTSVRGWMGESIEEAAALVIRPRDHEYDLGFVEKEGSVSLVADHHGGNVDRTLLELQPEYVTLAADRQSNGRFRRPQRTETEEHIQLRYIV